MPLVATVDVAAENYYQKQRQYQNDSTQDKKNEVDHALTIRSLLMLEHEKIMQCYTLFAGGLKSN